MIKKLIRITLVVRNQDEALRFYTEKLGFEERADLPMAPGQRWVTVAPKGDQ
jgi:catechol 2,3-dioxygenase-like lactoylglutathione lyase family enzyme